jgi:hypothetical protein
MANIYNLVNPYIEGKLNKSYKSDNSAKAAKFFYKELSEKFSNTLPTFYFSIQKGGITNGKIYHFCVNETCNKDKISYLIKRHIITNEKILNEQFYNKLITIKNDKQACVSTDISPITYWRYDSTVYDIQTIYMPSFIAPLKPIIKLSIA